MFECHHKEWESINAIAVIKLIDILFDQFKIAPDEKVKKNADPELKKKIKKLQALKAEAHKNKEKNQVTILQRKIHRMKRMTRG